MNGGVGNMGWNIYEVRFANGAVGTYRIGLSADGTIVGAMMTLGP
jgi:hypothetical protein